MVVDLSVGPKLRVSLERRSILNLPHQATWHKDTRKKG